MHQATSAPMPTPMPLPTATPTQMPEVTPQIVYDTGLTTANVPPQQPDRIQVFVAHQDYTL